MTLAIFDLDNTLLAGDSDYLWGVFLCDIGVVKRDYYESENERFYDEYKSGKLDIMEFLSFSLRPLSQHSPEQLYQWREQFMEERISPLISDKARKLVEKHRDQGDTLLIITATNSFVTAPIAERFGISNLIATNPEMEGGRYTGKVEGEPSYQQGKVRRLNHWLKKQSESMQGSWFYSDSHNDLPLLEEVSHPVAVDPDDALRKIAEERNWPILGLHQ